MESYIFACSLWPLSCQRTFHYEGRRRLWKGGMRFEVNYLLHPLRTNLFSLLEAACLRIHTAHILFTPILIEVSLSLYLSFSRFLSLVEQINIPKFFQTISSPSRPPSCSPSPSLGPASMAQSETVS